MPVQGIIFAFAVGAPPSFVDWCLFGGVLPTTTGDCNALVSALGWFECSFLIRNLASWMLMSRCDC